MTKAYSGLGESRPLLIIKAKARRRAARRPKKLTVAAKRQHLTREELERDEVADTIESFIKTVRENRMKILVALITLLLLIVGTQSLSGYRQRVAEETSQSMKEAQALIDQAVFSTTTEERDAKIDEAAKVLKSVIADRAGTDWELKATLVLGGAYLLRDDFAGAETTFGEYLATASDPEDRARGHIGLGNTYENRRFTTENAEDLEAALKQYRSAQGVAPEGSYLIAHAQIAEGRALEFAGRTEEARAIYLAVIESRPAPRTREESETTEFGATGSLFLDMALNQAFENEGALSYREQARLRLERIAGASSVVLSTSPSSPATEADSSPAEDAAPELAPDANPTPETDADTGPAANTDPASSPAPTPEG